jgi:hypothetical protein
MIRLRFLLSAVISIAAMGVGLRGSRAWGQEARAPLTFIVITDTSGSMEDRFPAPVQASLSDSSKLHDVKRQLRMLAEHLPLQTRVIVTAFDHEAKEVCDLRVDSAESRQTLQRHFDSIKSRNGSTFLWRTLDKELARASSIAQSDPENRVRVLLYTDGEDMEKAPGLDYQTIIRKYGKMLQADVRLNFITLGFDMKADVKEALRQAGVEVSKAVSPEEIAPLMAGVEISKATLVAGEELGLVDRSIGIGIQRRTVDWGDKSPYEEGDLLRHRYLTPGEYTIRYVIKTASGRSSETSKAVRVTAPPQRVTEIRLSSDKVLVGEAVRATDVTAGEATGRRWRSSGGQESASPVFEMRFDQPGRHRVELVRTDEYGRAGQGEACVEAVRPAPPKAIFRVANAPTRLGETIALINESEGPGNAFVWKIDGREFSEERHPKLVIGQYGSQVVTLTASDRYGQTAEAEVTITLPRPEAPEAKFELPERAEIGQTIVLVDGSSGEVTETPRWFVGNQEIGSGRSLAYRATQPGSFEVRLVVSGPGGTAEAKKTLRVANHAPPRAGFTVGNPAPFVGDVIRITDTATGGPIERMQFEVIGLREAVVHEFGQDAIEASFELECVQAGEIAIVQRVIGPGGEDELRKKVTIGSRAISPTADFELRVEPGEGTTRATFINLSRGDFERVTIDAGDGSEPRDYGRDKELVHEYGVGRWTPRITVHGPVDEALPESKWVGPEIVVDKPIAAWVRNLAWQIPLGTLIGLTALSGGYFLRQWKARMHQKLLSGHLIVRPTGKPRDVKTYEFAGESCEETVDLGGGSRLKLSSRDDGVLQYQAELFRDGHLVEAADLDEAVQVKLGDYFVCYSA